MDSCGTPHHADLEADTWIERLLDSICAEPSPDSEWEAIAFETCPIRCARERELALARLAEWTV